MSKASLWLLERMLSALNKTVRREIRRQDRVTEGRPIRSSDRSYLGAYPVQESKVAKAKGRNRRNQSDLLRVPSLRHLFDVQHRFALPHARLSFAPDEPSRRKVARAKPATRNAYSLATTPTVFDTVLYRGPDVSNADEHGLHCFFAVHVCAISTPPSVTYPTSTTGDFQTSTTAHQISLHTPPISATPPAMGPALAMVAMLGASIMITPASAISPVNDFLWLWPGGEGKVGCWIEIENKDEEDARMEVGSSEMGMERDGDVFAAPKMRLPPASSFLLQAPVYPPSSATALQTRRAMRPSWPIRHSWRNLHASDSFTPCISPAGIASLIAGHHGLPHSGLTAPIKRGDDQIQSKEIQRAKERADVVVKDGELTRSPTTIPPTRPPSCSCILLAPRFSP
ncbi:hypothetical protein BDV93DRAFT_544917 [Ceratobasidium sp. AG-I]|nr:hypothetical protein BDV93DRAFT_544917 [Ceratobasidium sp. AG-I]